MACVLPSLVEKLLQLELEHIQAPRVSITWCEPYALDLPGQTVEVWARDLAWLFANFE